MAERLQFVENETALKYVEQTAAELAGQPFPETPWWSHSEALQQDLREWIRRAADGEYVETVRFTSDPMRTEATSRENPSSDRYRRDSTSLPIAGRDASSASDSGANAGTTRKLDLVLSDTDTTFAEFDNSARVSPVSRGDGRCGSARRRRSTSFSKRFTLMTASASGPKSRPQETAANRTASNSASSNRTARCMGRSTRCAGHGRRR